MFWSKHYTMDQQVCELVGCKCPELIIVGSTGGMPPEPPRKNALKVKIHFASIEAKPIFLRNPEALFSTLQVPSEQKMPAFQF